MTNKLENEFNSEAKKSKSLTSGLAMQCESGR